MAIILFRIKGTVILKTWRKILLVVLYTTGVICGEKFILGWEATPELFENGKEITNTVVIFGLFTGFLLVFRTNTAYDRYWEGRKLWSTLILNIRILTRVIWTMVPYDRLSFWRSGFKISKKRHSKTQKKTFRTRTRRRARSTTCLVKRSARAKPSNKFARHSHGSVDIFKSSSKVAPAKFNSSVDSLGDLFETVSSNEQSRSPSPSQSQGSNYSKDFEWENYEFYKTATSKPNKNSKSSNKLIIEQISAINLLIAFAYATKNFLRGNHFYTEPNLLKLIKHVPHFQEDIEKDKHSKRQKIPPPNSRNIPVK